MVYFLPVALNIKNEEAERLAAEVASLSGSSLTQAVISALRTRRDLLLAQRKREKGVAQARAFLQREFWGRANVGAALTDDELLGYGDSGA